MKLSYIEYKHDDIEREFCVHPRDRIDHNEKDGHHESVQRQ